MSSDTHTTPIPSEKTWMTIRLIQEVSVYGTPPTDLLEARRMAASPQSQTTGITAVVETTAPNAHRITMRSGQKTTVEQLNLGF